MLFKSRQGHEVIGRQFIACIFAKQKYSPVGTIELTQAINCLPISNLPLWGKISTSNTFGAGAIIFCLKNGQKRALTGNGGNDKLEGN